VQIKESRYAAIGVVSLLFSYSRQACKRRYWKLASCGSISLDAEGTINSFDQWERITRQIATNRGGSSGIQVWRVISALSDR
jgi:hypothetical protein